MRRNRLVPIGLAVLSAVWAQDPAPWRDPSSHTVQFVTVEEGVRLEVLDWGGSGRTVVLIPGLGNTAHVFDEFAPKLAAGFHVYGITRRGFGESSAPASGYDADRLADDVLAVLDSLKISKPVLAGHSLGGEELSSIGSRHPDRVAGLIYLDAGYSYAFDNGKGMTIEAQSEAIKKPPPMGPFPVVADRASFSAFGEWYQRTDGIRMPEAEIRQLYNARPDGGIGLPRTQLRVAPAILAGFKKFTDIRAPVLAIFAVPHETPPWLGSADAPVRSRFESSNADFEALAEKQVKAFEEGVAGARVVRVPNAHHYVFISNEAEVLREMRAFLAQSKP